MNDNISLLEKRAKLCLEISAGFFKEHKSMPTNLVFFCSDKVITVVFDEVADEQKKYEIAFMAEMLVYLLGNVESIAFNSEAWILTVGETCTPDLWEEFNGDSDAIMKHIYDKYGSLEDCPYRLEALVTVIDDGTYDYISRSQIIREGDGVKLEEMEAYPSQADKQYSFHSRFNNLLYRGNVSKQLLDEMVKQGADLFPSHDDRDYLKQYGKYMKENFSVEFDIDKSLDLAYKVLASVGENKNDITLH